MVRYSLLFLSFLSLPLMPVTPQQIVSGAQVLYAALLKNDAEGAHKMASDYKRYGADIDLLKQARRIAKEKNDARSTQYLTEKIIEGQKSFWELHYKLITVAGLVLGLCAGYRLGVNIEHRKWVIWED